MKVGNINSFCEELKQLNRRKMPFIISRFVPKKTIISFKEMIFPGYILKKREGHDSSSSGALCKNLLDKHLSQKSF